MIYLILVYIAYLILYALISYAILFHLTRYRLPGDKSGMVLTFYLVISAIIIVGSFAFLRF